MPRHERHVPARDGVEVAHDRGPVVGRAAGPVQQRLHAPQPRPLAPARQPGRQVHARAAGGRPPRPGPPLEEAAGPPGRCHSSRIRRLAASSAATLQPGRRNTNGRPAARAIRSTAIGSVASWSSTTSGRSVASTPPMRATRRPPPNRMLYETRRSHPSRAGSRSGQPPSTTYGVPCSPDRRSRNQRAIAWRATGRPAAPGPRRGPARGVGIGEIGGGVVRAGWVLTPGSRTPRAPRPPSPHPPAARRRGRWCRGRGRRTARRTCRTRPGPTSLAARGASRRDAGLERRHEPREALEVPFERARDRAGEQRGLLGARRPERGDGRLQGRRPIERRTHVLELDPGCRADLVQPSCGVEEGGVGEPVVCPASSWPRGRRGRRRRRWHHPRSAAVDGARSSLPLSAA